MSFLFNTLTLISLFSYPCIIINNKAQTVWNLYDTTISTNQVVSYKTSWQQDNQTGTPQDFDMNFYYGANSVNDWIVNVNVERYSSDVTDLDTRWSYRIFTDLYFYWGDFDFGQYFPSFTTIITFSDYFGQHSYSITDYSYEGFYNIYFYNDCIVPYDMVDNDYIDTTPMDNFTISCTFIMDNEYIYNQGYEQGRFDTLNNTQWRLDNYLFAIADIPFYVMRNFFNDSLFGGPSLFIILMSLVTLGIVLTLVKKFL